MTRMFTLPRRSLAVLLAGLVLASAVGTAVLAPEIARADAVCSSWRIPSVWNIKQSNGWNLYGSTRVGAYQWDVVAFDYGAYHTLRGTLNLTRFDVSGVGPRVEFTVVFNNGTVAGFYTGTIDPYGFLSGVTYDVHNRANTASWYATEPIRCG